MLIEGVNHRCYWKKNAFNKGGYFYSLPQSAAFSLLTHFAPYFIEGVPQNAAFSLLTHFAPYFIEEVPQIAANSLSTHFAPY